MTKTVHVLLAIEVPDRKRPIPPPPPIEGVAAFIEANVIPVIESVGPGETQPALEAGEPVPAEVELDEECGG